MLLYDQKPRINHENLVYMSADDVGTLKTYSLKPSFEFSFLSGNSYWVTLLISIDFYGIHKYGLKLGMGQLTMTFISMQLT